MNRIMTSLLKPYFVSGKVVKGFGRGSKQLGIPTANIESSVVNNIDLKNGIYFGFSQLLSQKTNNNNISLNGCEGNSNAHQINNSESNATIYPMVCSLGWNPHFSNTVRSLEVHILNKFNYDFYGSILRVAICGYIRSEQKFESLDDLIEAIHKDIEITEQELRNEQKWSSIKNNDFFKS